MSNLTIYVLYDKKAQTIARVFLFKNEEVCLRFLKQNMNQLGVNLEDYELYNVGEIGEENLKIENARDINGDELEIESFENQECCKKFKILKQEYFDDLKKQKEAQKKYENAISNIRK